MPSKSDDAGEAAARLAEMIRRRANPGEVHAADEVKRLRLSAPEDFVLPSRAASSESRDTAREV